MKIKNVDKPGLILWGILFFAFILRLYYIFTTRFPHLVYDAKYYDQMARQFLHKGILGFNSTEPNAYVTPGFPLFLILIYRLFGAALINIRLMNVLLSVGTIYIVYKLAYLYLNKALCLVAAFIMAIYPSFIYANGLILTEVLFTFVFFLFLYLFAVGMKEENDFKYAAVAGVAFGAGVMVKPTALLLFIPLVGYYFIMNSDKKIVLKKAAAFIVPVVIIISPWVIRNYNIYGRFVMSTSSAHPFLWGTHPYAFSFNEVVNSYNKISVDTSELKRNELWKKQAFKNISWGIKHNPATYIKWYIFGKVNHFWFSPWTEYPEIMKFLGFLKLPIHWFIVIFGLIGFAISCFKNHRHVHMLGLIVVYFTLVHMVVLAIPRYLYPVIPVLIILALYAMQCIFTALIRKRGGVYAAS